MCKMYQLVFMSFCLASSFLRADVTESKYANIIANVDKTFVAEIVGSIDCKILVESIIFDFNTLYEKINHALLALNNSEATELSAQYLIRQYKNSLVTMQQLKKSQFLSVESQERILLWILLGADSLSSEKVAQQLMNDGNMQTVMMLMQMAGIELTTKHSLAEISSKVHQACSQLKNDDLNDISYEMTIYNIYQELAKKIVANGFFGQLFDFIFTFGLDALQEEIKSKKEKDQDKKLNNKKIDNKKKKK